MALRKVANGEVKSIRQLAEEKWRSSGINGAQARRLRLRGLTAEQTAALGPNYHRAASLFIPYFDLTGRPTRFHRVRYLEPLPGFAGQVKKPERFTQDIRALNEVYLPPLFGNKTWETISQDVKLTLYITEGELKAASGCGAGLAVLGLGGVDVWRAAKRGITFLPILEKFCWKERQVGIVYDSDLATKPDVVRAQRALAQELITRGALVSIVNIPPGKEGKKQGLDDFLVAEGADALQDLLANAIPYPESDALWALNEEVILIPKMGVVVERKSNDLIEAERFRRIVYANRHYLESTEVGKGKNKRTVLERKLLVPRWIEWEHRAQMEKITYEPGKSREYEGMWNVWPDWGCVPKKGDIGPWNWLLDFLFKDDHKTRHWFERWLAYPLQHPGTKMYTAVLMWSRVKRLGKTLAAYSMMGIYGKNAIEINNKSIKGDFNTWAKHRQFVYADEIKGSEAKIDADWLKNAITAHNVLMKEKYISDYVLPDRMNWLFASNHPDALFLEDGDQRYMVHEVQRSELERDAARPQFETCDKWLHNGGPATLFHHLMDLNLGDFNPRGHAPDTEGKRNMIHLGKNDVAWWVQSLKDDATQALKPLGPGIGATCDLYTPRQLFRAFDPEGKNRSGEAALGRALAAAGLRQLNHSIPMRTALGYQRIYAVRHFEDWEQASSAEIREHFDKFWAPDSPERKM